MPIPSSLKTLPPAVLAQVNFMITEGGWTIDQIVGYLSEAGHPRSRSAVGRHARNVNEVAAKLRESREVVDALVREMGPQATEGKHGRLLVEILRKLAFDSLLKKMDGEGEDLESQDFFFFAKAMKELSSSVRLEQDYVHKERDRIRAEEAEKLERGVKAVEDEAKGGKLTPAEALARVRAIYRGEA